MTREDPYRILHVTAGPSSSGKSALEPSGGPGFGEAEFSDSSRRAGRDGAGPPRVAAVACDCASCRQDSDASSASLSRSSPRGEASRREGYRHLPEARPDGRRVRADRVASRTVRSRSFPAPGIRGGRGARAHRPPDRAAGSRRTPDHWVGPSSSRRNDATARTNATRASPLSTAPAIRSDGPKLWVNASRTVSAA
jgi:hypothetical protein